MIITLNRGDFASASKRVSITIVKGIFCFLYVGLVVTVCGNLNLSINSFFNNSINRNANGNRNGFVQAEADGNMVSGKSPNQTKEKKSIHLHVSPSAIFPQIQSAKYQIAVFHLRFHHISMDSFEVGFRKGMYSIPFFIYCEDLIRYIKGFLNFVF